MADEKILSYEDVVLRQSDLSILSGPHFLNDRIIEFCFSHLSSTYPSHDVLLVPPSIAFWIANCSDEQTLKIFMEPLNLPSKSLVIFPVNNNEDVSLTEGGTHWSLLAFHRATNKFIHHDSLGGGNRRHAKRLYRSVVVFMGCSSESCAYIEYDASPQQMNGYDCGLYVIAIAKVIVLWRSIKISSVEHNEDDGKLWFSALKEQVTPTLVAQSRKEILRLIKQLMASK